MWNFSEELQREIFWFVALLMFAKADAYMFILATICLLKGKFNALLKFCMTLFVRNCKRIECQTLECLDFLPESDVKTCNYDLFSYLTSLSFPLCLTFGTLLLSILPTPPSSPFYPRCPFLPHPSFCSATDRSWVTGAFWVTF